MWLRGVEGLEKPLAIFRPEAAPQIPDREPNGRLPVQFVALAADRQGRFWDMHDLLFLRQRALEDDDLRRYAAELELDLARFDRARNGTAVLERVRRDVESGMASGEVEGTPTLFIDGVVYRGGYDAATLLEVVTG